MWLVPENSNSRQSTDRHQQGVIERDSNSPCVWAGPALLERKAPQNDHVTNDREWLESLLTNVCPLPRPCHHLLVPGYDASLFADGSSDLPTLHAGYHVSKVDILDSTVILTWV